jgi:thermitase
VQAAIADLKTHPGVMYAEPNYYAYASDVIPNDPGWVYQYNMVAIHAPAGWDWTTGSGWVNIAILDTGVDLYHPDLMYKNLPGWDFVNNDSIPQDDNGHGTHVAGIAAASSNNGIGVAGVNWGANILPVKVLNSSGGGTYANVAAGITWATDHGAQVINLSLGGSFPSLVLENAVNYAYDRGVILVAATGNAGVGSVLYPAAYPPVIAVAATDSTNTRASFSNYGPQVDVAAPGASIYSAFPGGGYGYRSGTSMAAPHVSGLAAILRGIPGNGPARTRMLIESTSLDLGAPGWDVYYGYGLIQMDAAIQQAWPMATPTATQTAAPTFTRTSIPTTFTPLGPYFPSIPTYTNPLTITPFRTASPTPSSTPSETAPPVEGQIIIIETATSTLSPVPEQQEPIAVAWWGICLGSGLIGAGGWLLWIAIRRKSRRRRRWGR